MDSVDVFVEYDFPESPDLLLELTSCASKLPFFDTAGPCDADDTDNAVLEGKGTGGATGAKLERTLVGAKGSE